MKYRIAAAFALIAASSLQAQSPAPANVAPAIPDLSTASPIPGNWTYAATADGSEATYLNSTAQPEVMLHCARAPRRVTISKPAAGVAAFLSIWTSTQSRNIPASYNPATARLSADVTAYDPLLDAIAFSRGRFGIGVSGQPIGVVPAWPEPARVVEDCRV